MDLSGFGLGWIWISICFRQFRIGLYWIKKNKNPNPLGLRRGRYWRLSPVAAAARLAPASARSTPSSPPTGGVGVGKEAAHPCASPPTLGSRAPTCSARLHLDRCLRPRRRHLRRPPPRLRARLPHQVPPHDVSTPSPPRLLPLPLSLAHSKMGIDSSCSCLHVFLLDACILGVAVQLHSRIGEGFAFALGFGSWGSCRSGYHCVLGESVFVITIILDLSYPCAELCL